MDELILLGVTLLLITTVVVLARLADGGDSTLGGFAFAAALVIGLATMVWVFTVPICYLVSNSDIGSLRAMRDTVDTYDDTIRLGQQLEVEGRSDLHKTITDFAYAGSGAELVLAIKERRALVRDYNSLLHSLQQRNRIPLLGLAYRDVPADMEPMR